MQNKSDIKTMLKEAGILLGITLVAGLLLGMVYELTKEPIRIQQEKAIQEACEAVFPYPGDADSGMDGQSPLSFSPLDYTLDEAFISELAGNGVKIGTVYLVRDNSGLPSDLTSGLAYITDLGYVVEATSKEGYGGDIVLYVGVDRDGTVTGVSILELSETAGLGMEAPKVLVPQFAGRTVNSFAYTKTGAQTDNEVDAITSATITTSAVVNAVNGGLHTAQYIMAHPECVNGLMGGGEDE